MLRNIRLDLFLHSKIVSIVWRAIRVRSQVCTEGLPYVIVRFYLLPEMWAARYSAS